MDTNTYIFQLNYMVQKFLGDLPIVSKLLGVVALCFLAYMLYLKFSVEKAKARNKLPLEDAKNKVRIEKYTTKFERQRGKTLNHQIKNLEKEKKVRDLQIALGIKKP